MCEAEHVSSYFVFMLKNELQSAALAFILGLSQLVLEVPRGIHSISVVDKGSLAALKFICKGVIEPKLKKNGITRVFFITKSPSMVLP